MKRQELIVTGLLLLFAMAISSYHVSYDGFLGLNDKFWGSLWAISENGFSLFLCWLLMRSTFGMISKVMKFVFIPYFSVKLIYHFSCYSGAYLWSVQAWTWLWSAVLVLLFIVSIIILWLSIK